MHLLPWLRTILHASSTRLTSFNGLFQAWMLCPNVASNAVVSLARQWGFEIGRRWGDANPPSARAGNLLSEPLPDQGAESERVLLSAEQWRLVLIQSNDYKSPEGEWMVQKDAEWVLLLRGSAELSFRGPEERIDLSVGDPVLIAPQRPHRVERTDPDPGTLWLALIWTSSRE